MRFHRAAGAQCVHLIVNERREAGAEPGTWTITLKALVTGTVLESYSTPATVSFLNFRSTPG